MIDNQTEIDIKFTEDVFLYCQKSGVKSKWQMEPGAKRREERRGSVCHVKPAGLVMGKRRNQVFDVFPDLPVNLASFVILLDDSIALSFPLRKCILSIEALVKSRGKGIATDVGLNARQE